MNKKTITVAGERLEDLEAALDHFDIEFEECGCVNMSGSLPEYLSQCLARALRTIEAEMSESADDHSFDAPEWNPMRELFLRIGIEINEHGR
jgi:hypothetical protein